MLKNVKFPWSEFVPKSVTCFEEGYSKEFLLKDLIAGVTVGIIALPLAMAFAIGSGLPPERGIYTAIIAGFLISLLGGSRVQIGGPTGAFVIIVSSVVERHGYEGLAIATLMAGVIMLLMGFARFGVLLKFIPFPVTTGFTTGIALVIFSSQIKDIFGLSLEKVPAGFIEKWGTYLRHAGTCCLAPALIAGGSLAFIFILRRIYPKIPGAIIAILMATLVVFLFDLPVETIQKKFGGIPRTLTAPSIPGITFEKFQLLFPDAISIALLGAIESLLSALVADGMTGHRHRSNCELVAQGIANIGSVLFGGIPATGAIARTTANIKMGAKTPVAGMIHAVVLLVLMLGFAPLAAMFPMPALAAVLVFVAWNMSELDSFYEIHKGPWADIVVLWITFLLTILVDLATAVQVGVLLAPFLFLKRMTDSTTVKICELLVEDEDQASPEAKDSEIIFRKDVPEQAAVFEINGPFFYAISNLLNEELRRLSVKPQFFILRMRKIPLIDATGIRALIHFDDTCKHQGIEFLLSSVREDMMELLGDSGVVAKLGPGHIFAHLDDALAYCRSKLK